MVTALVVSGGQGTRMGMDRPKQFLELKGIPVLLRTLMLFEKMEEVQHLVVVLPEAYIDFLDPYREMFSKLLHVVSSGSDRQSSVRRGLQKCMEIQEGGWVMIHDAVRPMVSMKTLEEGLQNAKRHGAAACGVRPKDTVKRRGADGFSTGTFSREELMLVQTPQVFPLKAIWDAHVRAEQETQFFTDDTQVYEAYVGPVYLYEGSYANIKITTMEDLVLSELLIEREKD